MPTQHNSILQFTPHPIIPYYSLLQPPPPKPLTTQTTQTSFHLPFTQPNPPSATLIMIQKSLLIGSGPLIGVEVAEIFAQNKFSHIALLSRSLSNLHRERETILSSLQDSTAQLPPNAQHSTHAQPSPKTQSSPKPQPPPEIKLWTADTTNPTSVVEAVREVGSWLGGKLDFFVYNPARVHRSSLLEWEGDEVIIGGLKTTTLTPHHLLPLLLSTTKPSIFITTSHLSLLPPPNFVTLSILKAAQRSLILSLQHEFGSKIHIALVYINGIVGRKRDGEGEGGMGDGFGGRLLDPKDIAGMFWGLYTDEKDHWRGEVDFGKWKS
ncbi:hypothetical protein HYALB_00005805 [Hymenoscyphus albidus]|uniref:NAD(P)-binding protein n=1 Tax=Hymenoscyphus albidus TaxID=595503 RepID=A0A9N9PTG9_9HELO|nr:hypothetical protein HYALB_00005805 [Hymenoscyphus albidus]